MIQSARSLVRAPPAAPGEPGAGRTATRELTVPGACRRASRSGPAQKRARRGHGLHVGRVEVPDAPRHEDAVDRLHVLTPVAQRGEEMGERDRAEHA